MPRYLKLIYLYLVELFGLGWVLLVGRLGFVGWFVFVCLFSSVGFVCLGFVCVWLIAWVFVCVKWPFLICIWFRLLL